MAVKWNRSKCISDSHSWRFSPFLFLHPPTFTLFAPVDSCSIGYYAASLSVEARTSQAICVACPADSTTTAQGSSSVTQCKCVTGFYTKTADGLVVCPRPAPHPLDDTSSKSEVACTPCFVFLIFDHGDRCISCQNINSRSILPHEWRSILPHEYVPNLSTGNAEWSILRSYGM